MFELYNRIKSKLQRDYISKKLDSTEYQLDMTFVDTNNNWYHPLFAGPLTFKDSLQSSETLKDVLGVLRKLDADEYVDFNINFIEKGLNNFGDDWRYGDINTALYSISKKIKVKNYLEIGVRRGRSMSMVAINQPNANIVGFDMWIENYVGQENPGANFVKNELKNIGYIGNLTLIEGNSRVTVPKYFKENKDLFFDIITVDGDHTRKGAKIDLQNVIPRLKVGGFLVFDDIINPWHTQLKKLWYKMVIKNERFLSYSFDENGYGVGIAIKKW